MDSSLPKDLIDSATESVIVAADPGRAEVVVLEKGWFPSTDLRYVLVLLAPPEEEEEEVVVVQDSARSREGRGTRPVGAMASSAAAANDAIRDVVVVEGDNDDDAVPALGPPAPVPARLELASLLDSTVRKLSTPDLTACNLLKASNQKTPLCFSLAVEELERRGTVLCYMRIMSSKTATLPLLALGSQFILT